MSSDDDFSRGGFQPPSNTQRFSYPGDQCVAQSSFTAPKPTNIGQAKIKVSRAPPPLPPRPVDSSIGGARYPAMSMGYGSPYSMGYGVRGLPYSGYNSFGGYPRSYSSGFYGNDADNLFIRMAEESSRPAFQSIESMVNAVGSISMMLESTYYAVYSSYRAVLGVVDQFSRLRNHLAHVISTLALIRTLQWLCQKILHLLGIRKENPSAEAVWSAASTAVTQSSPSMPETQTAWPIFMFMGLVFGAPWLIFRIFSKMASKKAKEILQPHNLDQRRVVALYEFHAARSGELSMSPGQIFYLAPRNLQPKSGGWCLVYNKDKKSGLVPVNYLQRIKILNKPQGKNNPGNSSAELSNINEEKDLSEESVETLIESYAEETKT